MFQLTGRNSIVAIFPSRKSPLSKTSINTFSTTLLKKHVNQSSFIREIAVIIGYSDRCITIFNMNKP